MGNFAERAGSKNSGCVCESHFSQVLLDWKALDDWRLSPGA